VLDAQVASDLHGRPGGALTSFEHALPEADSELVRDAIKDPYHFELPSLGAEAKRPALPDLPNLAIELTQMVETAEVVYTGTLDDEDDLVE
jgi:hypothetical protein